MRLTVGIYRYAVSELAGGGQGEGRETIGKTRWRVPSLPRKSPKVVNEGEGHPRVTRRTSARRLILNRSRILTFSFDFTAICNFSSRLAGSERKKKNIRSFVFVTRDCNRRPSRFLFNACNALLRVEDISSRQSPRGERDATALQRTRENSWELDKVIR